MTITANRAKITIIVRNLTPYILKVDFLDVRNPQKIKIFRKKIVSERENYQFCNVLEKRVEPSLPFYS